MQVWETSRIKGMAPSSSGATVIRRTMPPLASLRRWNMEASGSCRFSAAWAPRLASHRKGPSRWMPAHWAPSAGRRKSRMACMAGVRVSSFRVMVGARKEVTPWAA